MSEGVELEVPGLGKVKNLTEKHMANLCSIVTAVALSFGAFFLWQHDADAAKERGSIAQQIQQGNQELKSALEKQAEQARLQSCMMFLSLTPEQQAKVRLANPNICSPN